MYLTDNNYKNLNINTPTFGSRNQLIRTADRVCRNVNREFQIFSNTRLDKFSSCDCDMNLLRYKEAISDIVNAFRCFYELDIYPQKLFKMLDGMKSFKAGNCDELANATCAALKMNGFKNSRVCYLYSYNPKTKEIVDLDHSVAVLNLDIPKDYKFRCTDTPRFEELFKPNNKTLIIDTWAGFADFSRNAVLRYCNDIALSVKPKNDETIMLLPHRDISISEKELEFLKYKYPSLMLKNSKCDLSEEDVEYFQKISSIGNHNDIIYDIKRSRYLRSATPEYALQRYAQERCKQSFGFKVFNFLNKIISFLCN